MDRVKPGVRRAETCERVDLCEEAFSAGGGIFTPSCCVGCKHYIKRKKKQDRN